MKKTTLSLLVVLFSGPFLNAQNVQVGGDSIQFFRKNDQRGINVFETSKENNVKFDGLKLAIGGHFALQGQGLDHSTKAIDHTTGIRQELSPLSYGFNTATANLTLDLQLLDGVRMNITSYLSSRHYTYFQVKGGYLQIDKLSFLGTHMFDEAMKYITIKAGHMQIGYGDQQFRRTDNGNAMYNPFVGNYIMDAFTTEIGGEVYFQRKGIIGMVALSNGNTYGENKNDSETKKNDRAPSMYGKIGYDKKINNDLRLRLTASGYKSFGYSRNTLFAGDRTGSRYYGVMEGDDFSGNYIPYTGEGTTGDNNDEFDKMNAFVINPFVKFKGLEFFGSYECISQSKNIERNLSERFISQYAGEFIYRFLKNESAFAGFRYNLVTGDLGQKLSDAFVKSSIDRYQLSAGYFLSKNILVKGEYMLQNYLNFKQGIYDGGSFKGFTIEAVIGF